LKDQGKNDLGYDGENGVGVTDTMKKLNKLFKLQD